MSVRTLTALGLTTAALTLAALAASPGCAEPITEPEATSVSAASSKSSDVGPTVSELSREVDRLRREMAAARRSAQRNPKLAKLKATIGRLEHELKGLLSPEYRERVKNAERAMAHAEAVLDQLANELKQNAKLLQASEGVPGKAVSVSPAGRAESS